MYSGVVSCLPTCAKGVSVLVLGNGCCGTFWVLWGLLGILCVWGILALLIFSLILTGFGLRRCVFRWTRFLCGGRRGHFFCNYWGVACITQKKCCNFSFGWMNFRELMLYMLALGRRPSLRGRDGCMVFRANGASWRDCRHIFRKTSFSPLFCFFFFSVESNCWFFYGVGWFFGIFGLVVLGILVLALSLFRLKFSMSVGAYAL